MSKLQNKIALVTGGTTGIGRAAAELFHREGAHVFLTGRSEASVAEARTGLPQGIEVLASDTADLTAIDALVARVKERAGHLDVLFVNAGIAKFAPVADITPELFDQTFDINVRGAFFTVQRFLPLLRPGASVILNASAVTEIGMPTSSVYTASKAALASFAATLSADLREQGIRVNVISPGPISTPIYGKMGMAPEAVDGFAASILPRLLPGRFGEAEEVARTALFLASDDSSYVYGTNIKVDGGMTLA
jgi:NAD(P)-dependent dehydrogenase (short-subunit alcohol dehydrogenase family)